MKDPLLPVAMILVIALLPALLELRATPLTLAGAGVWLAWLGSGLLAASLLLMVREPAVAAWFGGLERMYRWHHALGTLGYVTLLAHPLLLAAPLLSGSPAAAWQGLSPFAVPRAVLLGWVALLALMGGLASTFAVRLRYGLWRLLHIALGVAVVLGIVHMVAVGGVPYIGLLVILPAAFALSWRLLRADRGGGARPYEVSAAARLPGQIIDATLRPLATPISVVPGQFVMAAFFEGPYFRGCGEYHPYTVSGMASDGALTLSIKALGDCTRNIQALEKGVAARVQGPYGAFLAKRPEAPELWIAGGIGITPFLALLRAGAVSRTTDLVYAYREASDAPHLAELIGHAASQSLFRFHPLIMQDDPAPLFAWLATVADLPSRQIYMCGHRHSWTPSATGCASTARRRSMFTSSGSSSGDEAPLPCLHRRFLDRGRHVLERQPLGFCGAVGGRDLYPG